MEKGVGAVREPPLPGLHELIYLIGFIPFGKGRKSEGYG